MYDDIFGELYSFPLWLFVFFSFLFHLLYQWLLTFHYAVINSVDNEVTLGFVFDVGLMPRFILPIT